MKDLDYNASMSKFIKTVLVLLILSPYLLFSDNTASSVFVYKYASPDSAGRALNRTKIINIKLERFNSTQSISAGADGIPTPLLIDSKVKTALDNLLADDNHVKVGSSIFEKEGGSGVEIYSFSWGKYGFEISFSFDSISKDIIAEIEKVYGNDAWLYGELKRSYSDNYSVRIRKAENVWGAEDNHIDFLEAIISATVIGNTFQPLLGVHDGLGVLDQLGLAAARADVIIGKEYLEYRKFEKNGGQIKSFMSNIGGMKGDFVDNLRGSIAGRRRIIEDDGEIVLPEEFFDMKEGDNSDFALFYYDILRRNKYQVKFIVIDSGAGELYSTVLFREKGSELWGLIDSNNLERKRFSNWRRLPALIFSSSVKYFEPDINKVISSRKITLPPPSMWSTSPY